MIISLKNITLKLENCILITNYKELNNALQAFKHELNYIYNK